MRIRIGTAGWTVPKAVAEKFPGEGGHLARYAGRFDAVEINSSFYRPHRPATYARWAECVPEDFRFAVKVPRLVTHELRLVDSSGPFESFLFETAPLGERLGPLLVQLPPSLAFDADAAEAFFAMLRERFQGPVACEPRHASWFTPDAEALLVRHAVARVAADPARAKGAGEPAGWPGLVYVRLHGSPQIYFSDYEPAYLEALARRLAALAAGGAEVWCIFDNTAHGFAAPNALSVRRLLRAGSVEVRIEAPGSAAARSCLAQYYAELAERFEAGFDPARSISATDAEMTPPAGYFVVAWLDGAPQGCGALKVGDGIGEIKRMWTAPSARGLGIARKVLRALEAKAREIGLRRLRLETNRALAEAQALYRREGYAEVAPFNAEPYAHHWFEKRL
ncbi:MAG TPA: GNAT family N-acetyltransferase [Beijerinckiaceae bacterium]